MEVPLLGHRDRVRDRERESRTFLLFFDVVRTDMRYVGEDHNNCHKHNGGLSQLSVDRVGDGFKFQT